MTAVLFGWLTVTIATANPGQDLFAREWTPAEGLGPRFNARSCAACHHQGGIGGAGGPEADVELLPGPGVVHRFSTAPGWAAQRRALLEGRRPGGAIGALPPSPPDRVRADPPAASAAVEAAVADYLPTDPVVDPLFIDDAEPVSLDLGALAEGVAAFAQDRRPTRRQTPTLFGVGQLAAVDEADLLAAQRAGEAAGVSGRIARDPDGRPGRLGWKGRQGSLDAFVQAACAGELGLSTPTVAAPRAPGTDDGALPGEPPDLDATQVDRLVAFVEALRPPSRPGGHGRGRAVLHDLGCTACHAEQLGSVHRAYTDLLLHDLGPDLADGHRAYAEPTPRGAARAAEWRTPPLWGLGDTAPYLHDGRAATVDAAIRLHGGEAEDARRAYEALSPADRRRLLAFLGASPAASSPPATAVAR